MNLELNKMLENADIGVLFLNTDFVIYHFTDIVTQLTSITKRDIGRKITDIEKYNNEEFVSILHRVSKLLEKVEKELVTKDGQTWLVKFSPYMLGNNLCGGIVIALLEQGKMELTEKQRNVERIKYRAIAELTEGGLWEYDPNTKEFIQSRKLNGDLFYGDSVVKNYRQQELVDGNIHPMDNGVFHQFCDSLDNGDDNFAYEFRIMGDNDKFMWVRFQGSAVRDGLGNVICVVGKTLNIDEEKKDRQDLVARSELDSLTQIYNSRTTKEKIIKCFERSNENTKHALYIIDIDDFKQINDRWGHLYGDVVIEGFSRELKKVFADTDIVGRFGGDEFLVLHKGVKEYKEIIDYAESIQAISSNGFTGLKSKNQFSVSIGISIFSIDGYTYDELFEKADIALYAAKASGKNVHLVYNERMSHGGTIGETTRKNSMILSKTQNVNSFPLKNKKLIEYVMDVSSQGKQLKTVLRNVFSEIGKYYDLGRIYIMEKDQKLQKCSLTYEWSKVGMDQVNGLLEKIVSQDCFHNNHNLKENKYFYYDDSPGRETLLNDAIGPDYSNFKRIGICALLCCALFDDGEYIGCIGYGKCNDTHQWQREELETLMAVTKIMEGSILKARSEIQLGKEEFYMQAMLNNQNMMNYAIAPHTYKVISFSDYTARKSPGIKIGDICYKSIMERDTPCETCPVEGLSLENSQYTVESYDKRHNAWYSATATSVVDQNGELLYVICCSDVTSFIERSNATDILTNVLSLTKFNGEAMKLLANGNKRFAVFSFDFNKFKYINNEYGYEVGNDILKLFAELVNKELLQTELFCRAGSDHFVLFMEYNDKEEVFKKVEYIIGKGQMILGKKFPSANIVIVCGIYFLKPEDKILSIAIDRANLAKKNIKGLHISNYAVYDEKLHRKITQEQKIEKQMISALVDREFIVYLQPKVNLITRKIVGAEALVRWKLPSGEMMPPSEFIPTFEKNGFILDLDFYVFEETFRKVREWKNQGKEPLVVSMNVSRVHLGDPKFMDKLDALVKKYRIATEFIELELNESIIFNNSERFIVFTKQLRERGFFVSIDDFGSGFSSLNLLTKLPVDILKIDREFFMENSMLQRNKAVIRSIIQLAQGLNLSVISEGVETEEQAEFLETIGCDMAQGFLFYRPLPISEFEKLL